MPLGRPSQKPRGEENYLAFFSPKPPRFLSLEMFHSLPGCEVGTIIKSPKNRIIKMFGAAPSPDIFYIFYKI